MKVVGGTSATTTSGSAPVIANGKASYDVCIIGGGVVGALVARELSRHRLRLVLIEEADDFPRGASRANSGVLHAGYDPAPGSLKAKLNVAGLSMYPRLCAELAVAWRRTGSLVVARDEAEATVLARLHERGRQNGVSGLELLSGEQARRLEPNLSPAVIAALHAPGAGIIDPHGLNVAALESAVANGVAVLRGVRATGFTASRSGRLTAVLTDRGPLLVRYAVNAAGLGAGALAAAAGDDIAVTARRGEYLLLDRDAGDLVGRPIFPVPGPGGKGILVLPTVHGNILAGPTAEDTADPRLTRTTAAGLANVLAAARALVPSFPRDQIIAAFSGARAIAGDDFVIAPSRTIRGLLHLAGICSPGLTAAPAIAKLACDMLADMGLRLVQRLDFKPERPAPLRLGDVDPKNRAALVAAQPSYGHVVCRCEGVSGGEIVDAIRAPVGARTVAGVKLRTRAGMGRCQGGFCSGRVSAILARELGIPIDQITVHGPGSWLVCDRSLLSRSNTEEGTDDDGICRG